MKNNYNWCPYRNMGIIFYLKDVATREGIMKKLDKQVTSAAGAVGAMACYLT